MTKGWQRYFLLILLTNQIATEITGVQYKYQKISHKSLLIESNTVNQTFDLVLAYFSMHLAQWGIQVYI